MTTNSTIENMGSSQDDTTPTAQGHEADNLDAVKHQVEKLLYDLFYEGMEAGEDDVLQCQFNREPGYKMRYADRCIKSAKDELADILAKVTDLQPSDPEANNRTAEAQS